MKMAGDSSASSFYADIKAANGVLKYYCNGEWLESASGKSVPVINPTTQAHDYAVQGAPSRQHKRFSEQHSSSSTRMETMALRPCFACAHGLTAVARRFQTCKMLI